MTEITLPPIKTNKDGKIRRVGFELEYTGITLEDSAALLAQQFGGKVVEESKSSFAVEDTPYGTFTVMLDMSMMQKLSADVAAELKSDPENETLKAKAERLLHPVVSLWMPNEIVTPPLPLDKLDDMNAMARLFRENGAQGTRASSIYAFGMHINAEMPGIEPARLRDYLAAFVLMQERLQIEGEMDITRQLSRFAKLFPEDYAAYILRPDYQPDIERLIDDYLRFNPTRNRALDMLPLFSHLDAERVKQAVPDDAVRPRPTFHYRLPNCDLDNPAWSPITEWNLWVKVEELAEDLEQLAAMSMAYLA